MAINLGDLESAALRLLVGTRNFAAVVAAIGTTTTKVKTTNAAQFCINGKQYTKAATDDLWTLAGAVIPASGTGYFLLCLNASGTASVIQGAVFNSDGTYNSLSPVKLGYHGDITNSSGTPTVCPIAEVKVVMGAGGAFTPGTTALTGGNIGSVTYTDLSCLPLGEKAA